MKIERTIEAETLGDMRVAGYRAISRHGEEYGWQYGSHWSTIPDHQNPERLFTESDVRKLLKKIEESKNKKNVEEIQKDFEFRLALIKRIEERKQWANNGLKLWIGLRRGSDAPAYRKLPDNIVELAIMTGVIVQ